LINVLISVLINLSLIMLSGMRILVVEDDVQLADILTDALSDQQYIVDLARDGESASEWMSKLTYDLIIMDITLPKIDGISLCRQLRDRGLILPIIMLTARDTIADKIIGLDAGADDYMVKPFDLQELMARVRALIRRGTQASTETLTWGQLQLNALTHEVHYENQEFFPTPKEYALLEFLVSNGRRVMSRAGIIDRLWPLQDSPTEEAVKSHIKALRSKLKSVGAPEDFIETVHGLGYRMK
jgi:DNA-binding response OmpR family regulator